MSKKKTGRRSGSAGPGVTIVSIPVCLSERSGALLLESELCGSISILHGLVGHSNHLIF